MSAYDITEIEIAYNNPLQPKDLPKINHAGHAFNVFLDQWDLNKLHLFSEAKMLLLTNAGRLLGMANLASGGATDHLIDPRIVFMTALKANATSIYIAHNHPSNNLRPSEADIQMHATLSDAAKLLNIHLRDYLIVDRDGFYSFTDDESYERVVENDDYYFQKMLPF
jgi:DNA repair protein RadC